MSAPKPNLGRVFSDSWRIISSNSLHFLALSALFVFPPALLSAIHTFTSKTPVSSPYGRLFSMQQQQDSDDVPHFHISQLLYSLPFLLFNLCSVASITHSIFHGFHNIPFTLSSSLKSTISSFFPLLLTKLAYLLITTLLMFAFTFLTGFFLLGLALLGFSIKPDSPNLMVFVFVFVAVLAVLYIYLEVEWFVVDASVVVESKFGFSPFKRSSKLVKGGRGVALLIWLFLGVLQKPMLWVVWYWSLASRSNGGVVGVGVQMGVCVVASSLLWVFSVGAHTVFFIYCRAFNGELELPTHDKLGEVYVPLPPDVEDVQQRSNILHLSLIIIICTVLICWFIILI